MTTNTLRTRHPWMDDDQFNRYCAFCILAELYTEALNSQNRKAWLVLDRIMNRVVPN